MVLRRRRDACHTDRSWSDCQTRDARGNVPAVRASRARAPHVRLSLSAEQGDANDPPHARAAEPRQPYRPGSTHDPRHDRRACQRQIPSQAAGERMIFLTYAIFALIALIACGFVAWPLLRRRSDRGRYVLACAATLFVLGTGGALYLQFGHPALAARALEGDNARDLNAPIGRLGVVVRSRPPHPRGCAIVGRAYLTAGDPGDAAKAFASAISAHPQMAAGPP